MSAAGDRQHLLFAAGKVAGTAKELFFEAWKQRERLLEIFFLLVLIPSPIGAQQQILPHRERRENLPSFGNLNEAALDDSMGRLMAQFGAVEKNRSRAGSQQARQRQ